MRTALAPSLTACAIRCACTWPSSAGGVSHTISIGMPCFCESSFAAASAPVRADRNTGLVELLAIIAIFSPRLAAVLAPAGAALSPPPHAATITVITSAARLFATLICIRFPSLLTFITARGAPPPRARAPALEDSLSSRGPQALLTARGAPLFSIAAGAPPPSAAVSHFVLAGGRLSRARAPALEDSLSSRGPQALLTSLPARAGAP